MWLPAALKDLPFSLLITSLALASALPVNTATLTPDNFKSTIAEGVWLVEHFSPYCPHCTDFAPTWDKLVQETENSSDPGIHLAQVNCAANGDLCDENNVKAYPQINLYRDGEFQEYYKGARSYDLLTAYIAKHAAPSSRSPQPPSTNDSPPPPQTDLGSTGEVITLDDNTFLSTLNQGPTFVKFYAPWCGHCKKLAPVWERLARHMQHKVNIAEVNCEEHGAICKAQGVQGYPTLSYYSSGESSVTEYTGGRKLEQLKSFAEKASAPALQAIKAEELQAHVEEDTVLYLFLHSESDTQVLDILSQSSKILLGSPPIYTSTAPELFTRFHIPASSTWALLALKDHDASAPTSVFYPHITTPSQLRDAMTPWLLANRLPTTTELTQDTFQGVMNAPHKPLVVIAAVNKDSRDKVAERFRDIGMKWRVHSGSGEGAEARPVVFTWMDVEKWTAWMKSMYGIKASSSGDNENVPIVVADHSKLIYYNEDSNGQPLKLTATSIFPVIEAISKGKLKAKNSENFAERMARYLNGKMITLEAYVVAHPLYAVLIVGASIVLLFLGLKKCISDDVPIGREQGQLRKGGTRRLD